MSKSLALGCTRARDGLCPRPGALAGYRSASIRGNFRGLQGEEFPMARASEYIEQPAQPQARVDDRYVR
jgi:hypothetical protein